MLWPFESATVAEFASLTSTEAFAFGLGANVMVPKKNKMSIDMAAPGTTLSTTISRHDKVVSSAPTAKGANASPTLPPMPCNDSAKPLRLGNMLPNKGMAVGCHKLLPMPTSITQMSSIQYCELKPIMRYGKPTQKSERAINWPFLPHTSTNMPPGTFEMAPAAYWHVMMKPIWL